MLVGHYDMLATTLHTLRVQPEDRTDVHDPTHPLRHVRDGLLDPLAGLAVGAADARARRQRLRRSRRRRLRAARRRAAPQRPRRRPARDRRHRGRPDAAGALRPGSGARRRDPRGVRGDGSRPRPGLRPAGRGGARCRRRVAAPAARPRHAAAGDGARAGDRLRPRRAPAARPRVGRDHRAGARPVRASTGPTSADLWLRDGAVPRAGELFANPAYAAVLRAAGRRAARPPAPTSPRRPRRPATRGAQGFVAEAVDALPPARVAALRRRGAAGAGRRRRPGGVLRDLGGAGRRWSGTASRSRRPACGARDRRCSRCWRCSTSSAGARSTRDRRDGIHAIAEAWKLAMADREAWFGDRSPGPGRRPARAALRRASGPPWSARPPTAAYDRARRVAASRAWPSTCGALLAGEATRPLRRRHDRRADRAARRRGRAATPATSTSSTAGAT